jgi:hypothetical protein
MTSIAAFLGIVMGGSAETGSEFSSPTHYSAFGFLVRHSLLYIVCATFTSFKVNVPKLIDHLLKNSNCSPQIILNIRQNARGRQALK